MSIVEKAVREYYQAQRLPKFDPKELRLSETGDCRRKRVLNALGYPVTHPISDQALRTMETGHIWEAWLLERIQETGSDCDSNVEIKTPHGAGGHIDIVLVDFETLERTIEDVKAVSQWTKVLPDPRHVDQVMAYLHFYGQRYGINRGRLNYIHRDTGAGPFIHEVLYDPEAGA